MADPVKIADIAAPEPMDIDSLPLEGVETTSEEGLQSIREGEAVSLPTLKTAPKRTSKPKAKPAPEQKRHSLPESVLSLPIKQREYVKAITDRQADTFGNQTQSALKIGYGSTYESAMAIGSRLSSNIKIQTAINDLLDENGMSSKDRVGILSDLARQRTAEILHYDSDGNLTQRQVVDNGKLRLQAVVQASKLAGDYARAENVAKAQRDALHPLVTHYAKLLRESLKAPHTEGATAGQGAIESVDGQNYGLQPADAVAGTGEGIQGIVEEDTDGGGAGG